MATTLAPPVVVTLPRRCGTAAAVVILRRDSGRATAARAARRTTRPATVDGPDRAVSRTPASRPHGSRAPGAAAAVRLTRRGQVLVVTALAGLLLAAFELGSALAAPTRPSAPARTVVVGANDSLWTIARRIAPHRDPRATVDRLMRLNHLREPRVYSGQTIVADR